MEPKENSYQVIISSAANSRMYEHFEFLSRVSVNAANKFLETLIKDITNLSVDPFLYPVYNNPYIQAGKYRYKISHKRYQIVYQISGNKIYVDDIQDCRQNIYITE